MSNVTVEGIVLNIFASHQDVVEVEETVIGNMTVEEVGVAIAGVLCVLALISARVFAKYKQRRRLRDPQHQARLANKAHEQAQQIEESLLLCDEGLPRLNEAIDQVTDITQRSLDAIDQLHHAVPTEQLEAERNVEGLNHQLNGAKKQVREAENQLVKEFRRAEQSLNRAERFVNHLLRSDHADDSTESQLPETGTFKQAIPETQDALFEIQDARKQIAARKAAYRATKADWDKRVADLQKDRVTRQVANEEAERAAIREALLQEAAQLRKAEHIERIREEERQKLARHGVPQTPKPKGKPAQVPTGQLKDMGRKLIRDVTKD